MMKRFAKEWMRCRDELEKDGCSPREIELAEWMFYQGARAFWNLQEENAQADFAQGHNAPTKRAGDAMRSMLAELEDQLAEFLRKNRHRMRPLPHTN